PYHPATWAGGQSRSCWLQTRMGRCPNRAPHTGQATRGGLILLATKRQQRGRTHMTSSHMSRRTMLTGATAAGALAATSRELLAQGARRPAPLPPRREFVIRGATVLTMDPNVADLASGDVHVRDGAIVALGARLNARGARAIEGRGMICMPG